MDRRKGIKLMNNMMAKYAVGAYLKILRECDIVDYDVKDPTIAPDALSVIGLDLKSKTAYLCKLDTGLRAFFNRLNRAAAKCIRLSHACQIKYAEMYLEDFPKKHYMFWSANAPSAFIKQELSELTTLELVLNQDYANCMQQLRERARATEVVIDNHFFSALQAIEQVNKEPHFIRRRRANCRLNNT